jgi:hypothetical protein
MVSYITSIPRSILNHTQQPNEFSIAHRLSWAAKRSTTRPEDEAYCLLGILGVNMTRIHGEGAEAFQRLQRDLIAQSTDQSIFAWNHPPPSADSQPHLSRELLLAPSPRCFLDGALIRQRSDTLLEAAYGLSNKGLDITLPILPARAAGIIDPQHPLLTLGLLDCHYKSASKVLALMMSPHPYAPQAGASVLEFWVSGCDTGIDRRRLSRVVPVSVRLHGEAKSSRITITKVRS